MTRTTAERIQGLLQAPDGERAGNNRRGSRSLNVATPEDIATVREALEQQNELLRAILASTVDTQADARSTAQNSRTFAWAGTAIALLTLIATVISVVAAVRAG
jgi:cell division protein FtsX